MADANYDIVARCGELRSDKSLKHIYELTVSYGDAVAAVWLENGEEKHITYAQYEDMTRAYAAFLRSALGEEKQGAYVAISMDTCKEWFPTYWGLVQAGYNVLLLDASLSDEMTLYMLRQAGAVGIVSPKTRKLADNICQVPTKELFAAPAAAQDFQPRYADSTAICTSGTTSTSRIFVYNGAAIAEQVLSSELVYNAQRRALDNRALRSLAFLPFHHVLGFMACLMWSCFTGYVNVYLKERTPQCIMETCQKCGVELLITVPLLANNLCTTLHKKLAKQGALKRAAFQTLKGVSLAAQSVAPNAGQKLAQKVLFAGVEKQMLGDKISCIILGGSHAPSEHVRMLNALGYFTLCGFGMTETAITSFEMADNLHKRTSGSVGKPLSNVEYRLQAGDKSGKRGEMLIRGASIHSGRLVDGKLLPPELLEGGWYPTGDIVRLEKGGRMFVEGRCKDIIVNESGENVYPDELEDAFSTLKGVERFTVLGVKKPGKHQKYEDITLALNVGQHYRDEAYLEELVGQIRALNQKLPTIKRLTRVVVTAEPLPLVNGIKVKRLQLKSQLEEGKIAYRDLRLTAEKKASAPVQEPSVVAKEVGPKDLQMEEIKQKVRGLYAEALDVPADGIDENANFIDDLGGDSLQVLSISLKVEELFNIVIPVEEYGRCTTISDMSALLYEKINGTAKYENQGDRAPEEEIVPITRFEDSPEFKAFDARQKALMADGDNPYFVAHDSPLLDTSLMAGDEVVNFGSYNYVGMSGRKEVKEAAKAAIDKYGTSASGSRLLAGEKTLHKELEKAIADWKHTETSLVLVGGHSTNVTIVGNFCGKNDLIVYDALAHNSIEQGCRLSRATSRPFPHNDPTALESILRMQRSKFEKVLIVIEGAYSMDGDIANVPAFVALKKKYGCFLMVDEAHSACVIGKTGRGVDEYFDLDPYDIDIKMGTLSKGLGTCGGYLAGPRCIIDYLRYNLPGFVFSVGISPALAAGSLEALNQLQHNPQIMQDMKRNIQCFVSEAKKRHLDICLAGETAIIPVLVGKDEDAFLLSNELRKVGVFVPPAVYPAVPKNKARLRYCVISEHKPEQIVSALDKLLQTAARLGIALPQREYSPEEMA